MRLLPSWAFVQRGRHRGTKTHDTSLRRVTGVGGGGAGENCRGSQQEEGSACLGVCQLDQGGKQWEEPVQGKEAGNAGLLGDRDDLPLSRAAVEMRWTLGKS